jgi:hypothetical protein
MYFKREKGKSLAYYEGYRKGLKAGFIFWGIIFTAVILFIELI